MTEWGTSHFPRISFVREFEQEMDEFGLTKMLGVLIFVSLKDDRGASAVSQVIPQLVIPQDEPRRRRLQDRSQL